MVKVLDVSAIAEQIRARLDEQRRQHQGIGDGLERVRDVLRRLEDEVRSLAGGARGSGAAPTSTQVTKPVPARKTTPAAKRTAAPKPKSTSGRAPRGENKAKVLAILESGPMTATEIAKQTGIGAASASTMLSRMVKAGELVKADRGYALPT